MLTALVAVVGTGCAVGQTGAPQQISDRGAVVGGTVISNSGGSVEYWAQYGSTIAYGSESDHATVSVQPNVPRGVDLSISGLSPSTTYHYRLCARDSQQTGGAGCGVDRTLKTQSFACGEPVATSVRLTGPAFCEQGIGLVVGADGIDVNLAGFEIATPSGSGGGGDAIRNEGYDDVTIHNGTLIGATRLTGASRNAIRNVVAGGGSDVISIEGGAGNAVRFSTLVARGAGIAVTGSDDFVAVGNRSSGGLGPGIRVGGQGARIAHNVVPTTNQAFPPGIELFGSNGRIVDNEVTGPWVNGGILLRAGANNVIAENDVSDAGADEGPFNDNFGDGIFVGAFTVGTLLRDNLAEGNSGDGIEVQASSARLRGNRAFDNGDFGIDAAAGVTDLGGNQAGGNGNPLQCRNVFCP